MNIIFTLFYIALTDNMYCDIGINAFATLEKVQESYEDQELFEIIFDSDIFRNPLLKQGEME